VVAGFVPQQHLPGAEAEVRLRRSGGWAGRGLTKCFLFTLRLSHSGKAVHGVLFGAPRGHRPPDPADDREGPGTGPRGHRPGRRPARRGPGRARYRLPVSDRGPRPRRRRRTPMPSRLRSRPGPDRSRVRGALHPDLPRDVRRDAPQLPPAPPHSPHRPTPSGASVAHADGGALAGDEPPVAKDRNDVGGVDLRGDVDVFEETALGKVGTAGAPGERSQQSERGGGGVRLG
jgi:hypothetical protein